MANLEKEIIDRYKGSLVGGAVGDALGAPVEFLSVSAIKNKFGEVNEMMGGGYFNWKVGETTDDTDQTMAIVDSLIAKGDYDPADIAQRFLEWYKSEPVDIGNTTRLSLSLLDDGLSWDVAGKTAMSLGATEGNGSLMRTGPLGLYFRNVADQIDKASDEISAITHAFPDCKMACRIASHLVATLSSGSSKDEAVIYLEGKYPDYTAAGFKFRNAIKGKYNNANPGYVIGTLGIALTSFMEGNDFEDVVKKSIHAGGDTDTQATVAGSFAGAYYGIDSIPARWRDKLNPFSAEEIEMKAEKLYHLNLKIQ